MALGDLVYYRMSQQDVEALQNLNMLRPRRGFQNPPVTNQTVGEQLRAVVVRENGDGTSNLNVQVDSPIPLHVRDVAQGAGNGQFSTVP